MIPVIFAETALAYLLRTDRLPYRQWAKAQVWGGIKRLTRVQSARDVRSFFFGASVGPDVLFSKSMVWTL